MNKLSWDLISGGVSTLWMSLFCLFDLYGNWVEFSALTNQLNFKHDLDSFQTRCEFDMRESPKRLYNKWISGI